MDTKMINAVFDGDSEQVGKKDSRALQRSVLKGYAARCGFILTLVGCLILNPNAAIAKTYQQANLVEKTKKSALGKESAAPAEKPAGDFLIKDAPKAVRDNRFLADRGVSKSEIEKFLATQATGKRDADAPAESDAKSAEQPISDDARQEQSASGGSWLSRWQNWFGFDSEHTADSAITPPPAVVSQSQLSPLAIVRHGLTVNATAKIEGSVQQLLAENTTLNSNGIITGDLLVPGVPSLTKQGNAALGGVISGSGSPTPTGHRITLNANSRLGRLVNRTDAVPMPTVAAPAASTATQSVTVNSGGQMPSSYANVRDLTLNSNVGNAVVPPGNYRNFTINSNNTLTLGTTGATQAVTYNFQTLVLNSNTELRITSPVIINLANGVTLNSNVSTSGNESWIKLNIAGGGLTLNSNSRFYGSVTAPNGTVTINSNSILTGGVICDRLVMNSNSLLRLLPTETAPSVAVAFTAPTDNYSTGQSSVNVNGTAQSAIGIAGVYLNGQAVAFNSADNSWAVSGFPLQLGANVLTAKAVDSQGGMATAQITVTRTSPPTDTTPPVVAITTPTNNTTTQAETVTVSGTVADLGENASGVASVTVNGTMAQRDVVAGTWNLPNAALSVGANTFNVIATDNAGNSASASVGITREEKTPPDTTAPEINIYTPDNNAVVYTSEVTVNGFAADFGDFATGIKRITVNGHAAQYDAGSRTWTLSGVSLQEGNNTITAEAEDNAHPTPNTARSQIVITRRNPSPPQIVLTSPQNGASVAANSVTVAGRVTTEGSNTPVTVTVNGQNTVLNGNEFSLVVPLNTGLNSINIVASAGQNQTSQTSLTVTSDTVNPTIALQNVPPFVRPSQTYRIQAIASDNVAVGAVEFAVNGRSVSVLQNQPYEFDLEIPSDAVAGNIYNISALVRDTAGNSFADNAQTVIAGASGLTGYVFDDTTGYTIPQAAAVLLSPDTASTTDENGSYQIVSNKSFGTVRISKNGYTLVERNFTTNAGTGLNLFDARLTPVDANTNQIGASGGIATGDGGRLKVGFNAGTFGSETDVRVTGISPQGLATLLPYGWSPVPSAVVDVRPAESAAPSSQNFPALAELTVNLPNSLTLPANLTLVRYDEVRHRWTTLEASLPVGSAGVLTAQIPSFGQYAFVVADGGETTPPVPSVGNELPSAVEVSDSVLSGARVTATAAPRSAVVSPNAKSTITVNAESVIKLPSGVAIEAAFDENYKLLNEREPLVVERLPQDFVLYSYPVATPQQPKLLSANFIAKPTRTDLTTAQLQFGKVRIGIHAGRGTTSGVLIGTNGGEVTSEDGTIVRLPANSLSQNTSVFLQSVDRNLTGVSLPEGYEIIGAADLNLSGATLAQSGEIAIPPVGGDNSRVVVAKLITAGSLRGLKVVGKAVESNNRLVSAVSGHGIPNDFVLSGVRSGGRYVFVRVPMPYGFVNGNVTSGGANLANVRVTVYRTPFIDLTDADGAYLTLTSAENDAPNEIDAVKLGGDATGNAQVVTAAQDSSATANIALGSTPLAVQSINPPNGASNFQVSSPITVIFNKPVNPLTLTGSNFKVTKADGNPVIGTINFLAGNRTASFTPNANLAYAADYRVKIGTAVKDIYGGNLPNEFSTTFRTAAAVAVNNRLKPEKIVISYPNEQGVSTLNIPAGSVPPGSIITVINNNSGATVSTVAASDAINLQISARLGDELVLTIRQPDGVIYEVRQAAYRRADGAMTVGSNGGTITSDDGKVLLAVPRGAIEGEVNLKMAEARENEITAPRTGEMSPTEAPFAAATKIEASGNFVQKEELHLELVAPPNLNEGDRAVFMKPRKITGNGVEREIWEVVTTGRVENGKIKTNSPPYLGLFLASVVEALFPNYYVAITPRRTGIVGKITEKSTVNGVQRSVPVANALVHLPESDLVQTRTNAKGEFGLTTTLDRSRVKIDHGGRIAEVETRPFNSFDPQWTVFPHWLTAINGFENRFAGYEFSDPAGDPETQPAHIEVEARTANLPDGEPDILKTTGRVVAGRTVELTVKTTPSVEELKGTLSVNGTNVPVLVERVESQTDTYRINIPTQTAGAYSVTIQAWRKRTVPVTRSSISYNFVALTDPNTCTSTDGNPSVLDGYSPRSGARNVDVGTRIHVNFSEPVKNLVAGQTFTLQENGAQISGTLTTGGNPVGSGTLVCSVDFQPTVALKGDKEYVFRVSDGVKDSNDNPLQAGLESRFKTFAPVVLNGENTVTGSPYRVASADNYLVTMEMSGDYPATGKLKLYDVSEPQNIQFINETRMPQVGLGMDFVEYPPDQILEFGAKRYTNVLAVTTLSNGNINLQNNVWFYSVVTQPANGQTPETTSLQPIGVVSLGTTNSGAPPPTSVKILGRRAYVGSFAREGFWVVDMEGAISQFEESNGVGTGLATTIRGFAADRVRQRVTNLVRDMSWRTGGISVVNQAVDNKVVPVVYPLPIIQGRPEVARAAVNTDGARFDNFMSFAGNGTQDDRVLSLGTITPNEYLIDVKTAGQTSLNGRTFDLAAYLGTNGFWLYDVKNPRQTAQLSRIDFAALNIVGRAEAMELEGKFLYVLFADRVVVFDISNPNEPYVKAEITGIGNGMRRFAVRNGFIYTVGSTGLRVSIARPYIAVLVRGRNSNADQSCILPVLIDKSTKKLLQNVEVLIQIYGTDLPQTAQVKITRERFVDNELQSEDISTLATADRTGQTGGQNYLAKSALWVYGSPIDTDYTYRAQVLLNGGLGDELASKKEMIPFSYLLETANDISLDTTPQAPENGRDLNEKVIGKVPLMLGSQSVVSVKINGVEIRRGGYDEFVRRYQQNNNGQAPTLDQFHTFPLGAGVFEITRNSFRQAGSQVPADGTYNFEVKAKTDIDNQEFTQTETGRVVIGSTRREVRRPGETVVNNVELQSGNLSLNYTDVVIPYRRQPLSFARYYNSQQAERFTSMGYGWSHNYNVSLLVSGSDSATSYKLIGGEGSGQLFREANINAATGEMPAEKPYLGTLRKNPDGSLDYYTKGRTKYHFNTTFSSDLGLNFGNLRYIEDPNGNRTTLNYDPYGRLERVTDGAGRFLAFTYEQTESAVLAGFDAQGEDAVACDRRNVWSLMRKNFLRGTSRLGWRIKEISGTGGVRLEYRYDENSNLIEAKRSVLDDTISGQAGSDVIWKYKYNEIQTENERGRHLLTTVQSPNGANGSTHQTKYDYQYSLEEGNRVKTITFPEGVGNAFAYQKLSETVSETTVTDGRGKDTKYTFNGAESVGGYPSTEIAAPLNSRSKITFTLFGQKKIVKNNENQNTVYNYDEQQNPFEIIEQTSLGEEVSKTQYTYDAKFNKLTTMTVFRGDQTLLTTYIINPANGNITSAILPNGQTVQMLYNEKGDVVSQTDQYGNTTETQYDQYGNPTRITVKNAGGGVVQVSNRSYDARSRLTASSGTLEPTVSYEYDAQDRLVKQQVVDPQNIRDGVIVQTSYLPEGQPRTVTQTGSGTSYGVVNEYDNLNRLKTINENVGGQSYTQSVTYDENSNVLTKSDRRGSVTTRVYNDLNFVTQETVSGSGGTFVTMNVTDMDTLGNVKKYTDLYGREFEKLYDRAKRVREIIYPDCKATEVCSETYSYDNLGNVTQKTDRNGRQTLISYDLLNRPQTVTNPRGYKTTYTYNDEAQTTQVFDAMRGLTQKTKTDALGRPLEETISFGESQYKTSYQYSGLTRSITDARGVLTTQKLSSFGEVGESTTSGTGEFDQTVTTQMRYSAFGAARQMTDALGRRTTFVVDGMNRVLRADYPAPAHLGAVSETFTYDGEGLLVAQTDKRGISSQISYDALGRRTQMRVNNGVWVDVETTVYGDAQAKETITNANGNATQMFYDGLHRVKGVVNAEGKAKAYQYDGENLTAESDFKGAWTQYQYDELNRPLKTIDRVGQQTTVAHVDGSIYTKTVTDRRGNRTVEKYDALGRLLEVTSGGELVMRYEYDANGNRTAQTDGRNSRSEFTYNNLNRLAVSRKGATDGGFLQTESYVYDAVGNLQTMSDGRGGAVTQTFDAANNLLTRRDGLNNETQFKHDAMGLLLETVEPEGGRTAYSYNAFGAVTSVTDALGKTWQFAYKPDGKSLAETTDPLLRKVAYTYDALDRVKTVKQPIVPASVYGYDENGNLTALTDAKGQRQAATYDALDRVAMRVYKDANNAPALSYQYVYDAESNVREIGETVSIGAGGNYREVREYDARNRLTKATDKFGHETWFGYDAADNITRIGERKSASSTLSETAYQYDGMGRIRTVGLPNGEAVGYEWETDGLLKQVGYATGMSRRYVYDEADRVTGIANTISGSEKQEFAYGYDRNANRTEETKKLNGRVSRSYGYQYDNLNRLKQSRETVTAADTQPQPNQSVTVNEVTNIAGYEYDEVGNRTKEKTQTENIEIVRTANGQGTVSETRGSPTLTPVQTATASFDDLNRLISLTEADGTANTLSYDANGNLLQTKRNNVVTQSYEYDPRNQLRKVLGGDNAEIARFDYDESRRRVEKTVYGLTPERYVYAGDKIVAEYRGNSGYETPQAKYQIGADEVVRAEFTNGNEGGRYYFTDALGSTTALAGQNNGAYTATNRYDYNDWGRVTSNQQSNNSIGYTGQRLDSETGLMALGNGERYYSPTLARFIQQDSWLGDSQLPQSLNRFAYGYNNPYKYIDPSGNNPLAAGIVGFLAGGFLGASYSYEMQNAEIADGIRKPEEFSWGEVAWSGTKGAVLGALMGVGAALAIAATPIALPLMVAGGVFTSATEIIKGHYEEAAGYKNIGAVDKKYGVIGVVLSLLGVVGGRGHRGGLARGTPKVIEESPTSVVTQSRAVKSSVSEVQAELPFGKPLREQSSQLELPFGESIRSGKSPIAEESPTVVTRNAKQRSLDFEPEQIELDFRSRGQQLRDKYANLSDEQRAIRIEELTESIADNRLQKLELDVANAGVNEPHFRGKHGANTSRQQQYDRAINGIDPRTGVQSLRRNGQPATPPSATRFFRAKDQINSIERAMNIMRKTGRLDYAERPIIYRQAVGEGFNRLGIYKQSNSVTTKFDRSTGLPYTNFPNY